MIEPEPEEGFATWGVVELMGYVRLAGRITEEERFGTKLGRIDIPTGDGDGDLVTQYFSGSSIYRVTPCSEEAARQVARANQPAPIYRLELTTRSTEAVIVEHDDDDDEEEGEPW